MMLSRVRNAGAAAREWAVGTYARVRTALGTSRGQTAVVIVAFAAVVLLGWAYFTYVYLPPNTVVLRDDGWHPRTLTVKAGQTVTFKSQRGKYFWPASDFHPTHTLYPKFDPKKPIAPTASWSFTFDEPGVYPFHDHLAAYFFGIVRVTDADGKVVDTCMKNGQLECWQTQIFSTLAEKGVKAAYDQVAELYAKEPVFAANCHYIAHNIGLASYQFYRNDHSFILAPNAVACAGGFYHGFMEGFLGATGDPKAAARVCDAIGKAVGNVEPDARLQCYHGIGHGSIETYIATTGQIETAADMARGALTMCEQASSGKDERYRCASGLFNGIANFYIDSQFGFSLTTSDPVKLCASQPDAYKESCYGNMNATFKWEAKNDLGKAAAIVMRIPDVANRESAIQYLAGVFATDHLSDTNYAPIVTGCRTLSEPYRTDCFVGFAHGLMEHGLPGKEYEKAIAFCNDQALSPAERDACDTHIIGTLPGWYSQEKADAICQALPASLSRYCTSKKS